MTVTEEELLAKAGDNVKEIYKKIKKTVLKFGEVQINCSKRGIYFKNGSTFLAVIPRKLTMDVEFILPVVVNEFPIIKMLRMSKNRIAHTVKIDAPDDVDAQLLNWFKEGYDSLKS
ncbi:MAG: hypothetical protein JST82_16650 [Bacteroidetes bacterium]|nr:hypothetical protein [Bacteroidota bacterium]